MLYITLSLISDIIIEFFVVSFRPPLSLVIKAHPLLEASRLDLPNGSSHLDGTTEILTFFNMFNIYWFDLKPNNFNLLCSNTNFSLGSSPITTEDQSGNSFKIFIIALPNTS